MNKATSRRALLHVGALSGFVATSGLALPAVARESKKTGAEELDLHHRNLQAAIRRNEPLRCDAKLGYYGVVATAMGNLSYRQRKYMRWDATKQRAV